MKTHGTGRLTREIELRYLPSGQAVAKTGIATSKKYKDKTTGETKETTMFIDITVWGKSAEIFNQYCQKGHKIYIEGELVYEQWDDKETGQKRSKHTVNVESFEFLESKKDNQNDSNADNTEYETYKAPDVPNKPKVLEIEISDTDLPF